MGHLMVKRKLDFTNSQEDGLITVVMVTNWSAGGMPWRMYFALMQGISTSAYMYE